MTAKEWRKYDETTPLIMLTEDKGSFYSKPMLSNSFRIGKSSEQLITSTVAEMAEQLRAEIKTQCHVVSIDSKQKLVVTEHETIEYNQLVLACGASARHLLIAGEAAKEVLSVNDLDQYTLFRSRIEDAKHVTIIGTGLVGCEFANDLRHHGYDITMLSPDEWVLQRFLPQPIAKHIQCALEDFGVNCHLQTTISELTYDAHHRIQVSTSQPELSFHTDVILSAAGLIPNIELAKTAGIICQRAIPVNDYLETSEHNIYALGDCVAYNNNQQKMYVAPILHAARALGKTLAGQRTTLSLPSLPVKVKTSVCPLAFLLPKDTNNMDWQYEVNSNHEGIALCHDDNEHLNGFILWGKATAQQVKWLKAINTAVSSS